MGTLTRTMIEKLFPVHIYERGLVYYNRNRVHGLSFNKQTDKWFAEVSGTQDYYVEVDLSTMKEGSIKAYCECPAFEMYNSCKHLVAVMLEVADKATEPKISKRVTSQFMEGIIQTASPTINVISDKVPMKVEYVLTFERWTDKIWLELKTGVDHCYVVRNVRELLEHVLQDEEHFFTNKFTYNPHDHYFLTEDMDILQQLKAFISTGDIYTDRSYYAENAYDKRSLLIPPLSFSALLEKLMERSLTVEVNNETYTNIEVEHDDIPFSYTVAHDEQEQLILKMDGIEGAIYFSDYHMVFIDGVFYFPTEAQQQTLEQIKRIGMADHELPIPREMQDQFFSEALPVLKKQSEVDISSNVADEIVEYPLQAKLYLEKNEEMIVGKLEYHYGPIEINPFTNATDDERIIIRDVEKEQEIMHLVEQSNFHYNGKELYINLLEDEETYDFLYIILPKLDEVVALYLTSDIQHLIVENEPIPSTSINVETSSNLLEIGFDISGVNDEEVTAMIQAVIEKKRFYRLQSGAMVSLESDEYRSIKRLFEDVDVTSEDMIDGKVVLPVYRGMQVDELIKTKKDYDPSFQQLLRRLQSPEEQVYPIPETLEADLRHYQEVGYQWFKSLSEYQLGGILADDMGLGKTVQTIAYLLSEKSERPHLVVVPSSVIYNWRNECERFAPTLQVEVIAGTPEERKQLLEATDSADIWITSYGTIRQDIDMYRTKTFHSLILDEAQFIKNHLTKTSKAVQEIKATKRFALSGTPIENNIDELWAIFQVILPGLMPSLKDFRKLEAEKISRLTRPFILRRVKEEVLKELPEKIESVHVSELTKEQKNLYVGYLQDLQKMASDSIAANNFQQNRMKILAGLTRLRQLCCHPSLFIENYEGRSGKLDDLMETVQEMKESGRRMLIFSQFTSMHELFIQELEKQGIEYFYLHGQTPAKERIEMSNAFNEGEKSVFLISLRAGGTGLNLTGADTVILYDLWWNPAVEDQAAGRAHRFGQKNVVQVIRFITEGTIEERIYELQQKKRELINQVIQPGETMLSSLSEDDVRQLLSL
ncbi:MAG TPA: DEAD/DEAH box helicase [Pseudogracilibacillus sp.]|nr:DEAD/DEAH box helicase [Pseudogracilibacillus sp.]